MPGASSNAQSSHSQHMPATLARTGWGWWLWKCTGPCPVVLRASGLQWGQGDRSLSHKVLVPGTLRGFLAPGFAGTPIHQMGTGKKSSP